MFSRLLSRRRGAPAPGAVRVSRHRGFTLLELMVAMALTAAAMIALSAIVFQTVRLGDALSGRNRGPWKTDRVLHEFLRRVSCACTPPGLPTETLPFALGTGDGASAPLLRLDFHAPRPIGADSDWPLVERVAYEVWPAPGHSGDGVRELRRLTLSAVPRSTPAWHTNVLFAVPFEMDVFARAAPSEPSGAWGEWRIDWPPPAPVSTAPAGETADNPPPPPPLPGAVRLEFRLRDEPPVTLETIVHAAQLPLRPVAPAQ